MAAMIFIDVVWLTLGVVWLVNCYMSVEIGEAKEIMLGKWQRNAKIALKIMMNESVCHV